MKFNSLIKYALRFIFLQGVLTSFIIFYFDNFLISNQDFKQAIDNIDIENVNISWTGYSEATLHSSFPDFLRLARKKGLPQVISTTLAGREDSCLAAINYKYWINFKKLPRMDNC